MTARRHILAVADDLSGAAETASLLTSRETRTQIVLDRAPLATLLDSAGPRETWVVDLDSRHRSARAAADELRATLALPGLPDRTLIVKKIDSLLRGNVRSELAALAERVPFVIAPALPVLNRVVRDGVVYVDGAPLAATDAWRVENDPPPASVAAAVAGVPIDTLGLATVRSARLARAISDCVERGVSVVCDAETDEDLDAVVQATIALPSVALVGSGGAAAAVGRWLGGPAAAGSRASSDPAGPHRTAAALGPLVVVGSAEPGAARQVDVLVECGIASIVLSPDELLADTLGTADVERTVAALQTGPVVVHLDRAVPPTPDTSRDLVRRLAAVIARSVRRSRGPVDLVLTGGETARSVLDALDVDRLTPVGQIHHGAVHSRTPDGTSVVTRPGSFGGPDSLLTILAALGAPLQPDTARSHRPQPARRQKDERMPSAPTPPGAPRAEPPIIAVTMGDGAGVGPEVVVGALLNAEVAAGCSPLVVGDAGRLRQAAEILGVHADVVPVAGVADALFEPGRINVIDLGLLPEDLAWGRLSPIAGDAAYQYVRVASELAVAGEVDAICTAPLNKEALHAGGHLYPGHTEMLAQLTGTDEVSMMLSSPKVRVIHVTTHIGLIDAIAKIEPGLVERTVRRGHEALRRAGIPTPKIGVLGINPHAGENGLFGYGEEEEKIVPALEVLQADGIDARGPLPADTAFFLAGRGDYDLIVAMYHDQGHAPVKILGIETGVNITVGLPVIRTSVDHGTAFDIAGTGAVEIGSMIEALRQAAQMSSATVR
jgi:4-hydroxythreonine-4-phosphate dehydrogenase